VTIHNTCVWLSALCHLAGVSLSLRPRRAMRGAGLWLAAAYAVTLGAVGSVTLATLAGWLPTFFVQGQGGTPVRQHVLGSAIVMFVLTATLLGLVNRRSLSAFAYWYSLALALTAAGLFGVMLEPAHGSVLSWTGRATQYLGGAYMLVAAIASAHESREWGIPLEAALSEARQRFDALFASAADGILVHDFVSGPTRAKFFQVNQAICDMLGYTLKEMRALGVLDVVAPEDHPAVYQARETLTRHGVLRHEKTLLAKDGRRIPAELHTRLIQHQGRPMVVSVIRDITARKRAEEALRESEARYRGLVDLAPDAVLVHQEGRIVYCNAAAARLYGAETIEQLLGRSILEIVHADELEAVETRIRSVLEGGTTSLREFRHLRLNGEEVPVEAMSVLIGWQGKPAVQSIARDITARKRAEGSLRRSEALYRAIARSIPDGAVWVVDPDLRIVVVEGALAARIGMGRERLEGHTLAEAFDEEWRRQLAEQRFRSALGGEGASYETEFHGRSLWAQYVPLHDPAGQVVAAMALALDITERKRVEEQLRQAQKLESIGRLAGGIAHDFNNLLIGVVGNSSLALDMLPHGHPVAELLQRIAKAGELAAHLTRQMLAYSGKGQFLVEPVQLSDVVAEVSELVQRSIPKKVTLHLDLARDLPPVEADRGQVQQVVMNLLLNAGEAIGGDTGLITVRTGVEAVDEGHLRRDLEGAELHPGNYVLLEVRDTGCGMDEATKAKIFDPFFTTKFTGRGLGLPAVAGILRGHKGAIEVTSEPGKGSCFVALFPAAEVAPSPAPVPTRGRKALRESGTVLVVDDEELVRDMAKRSLERLGFKVLLADSGLAAIDLFKTEPKRISLVILDLSMPGMSGAEILPELRKIRSRVKVLVSSGYGEAESMKVFRGQRVAGFIQKPYTSSQLAETVMSVIG
jgi:two-component system, cell cycle sensor histidine kinase and response regulator CckA